MNDNDQCRAQRAGGEFCLAAMGHRGDHKWPSKVNEELRIEATDADTNHPEPNLPTPEWERWWPEFRARLEAKLAMGFHQYGDASFDLPADRLMRELEAELLDICGWSLIMWTRLQRMHQALVGKSTSGS